MTSLANALADRNRNDDPRPPLASVATGRAESLFAADVAACRDRIAAALAGRRVLCVGGAGSIGSSTTALAASFGPRALHVIDQNENATRRSGAPVPFAGLVAQGGDFRALPLDYGSPVTRLFLLEREPYDLVLNFAAIKHVRSEKDAFSVLQMFDTNLRKQAQFLRWLDERGFAGRYFSVSTDKAANPTSMMGATKRVMEHVMFALDTARRTCERGHLGALCQCRLLQRLAAAKLRAALRPRRAAGGATGHEAVFRFAGGIRADLPDRRRRCPAWGHRHSAARSARASSAAGRGGGEVPGAARIHGGAL